MGAKNISDRRMFEMGMTHKDLPGEAPMSDDEKALYSEIQTLQSKLDNLKFNKKANKSKMFMDASWRKATRHKKVSQLRRLRNPKLRNNNRIRK